MSFRCATPRCSLQALLLLPMLRSGAAVLPDIRIIRGRVRILELLEHCSSVPLPGETTKAETPHKMFLYRVPVWVSFCLVPRISIALDLGVVDRMTITLFLLTILAKAGWASGSALFFDSRSK